MFWLVVLGMIVASGFIAWVVNSDMADDSHAVVHLVATGMAARSLVRAPIQAKLANENLTFGSNDKASLRDAFR